MPEPTSLGITDSRVALYLLFAAEVSLFTTIIGASIVLRFASDASPAPYRGALYISAAALAIHLLCGAVFQLVRDESSRPGSMGLFWKLTAVLVMFVTGSFVLLLR